MDNIKGDTTSYIKRNFTSTRSLIIFLHGSSSYMEKIKCRPSYQRKYEKDFISKDFISIFLFLFFVKSPTLLDQKWISSTQSMPSRRALSYLVIKEVPKNMNPSIETLELSRRGSSCQKDQFFHLSDQNLQCCIQMSKLSYQVKTIENQVIKKTLCQQDLSYISHV